MAAAPIPPPGPMPPPGAVQPEQAPQESAIATGASLSDNAFEMAKQSLQAIGQNMSELADILQQINPELMVHVSMMANAGKALAAGLEQSNEQRQGVVSSPQPVNPAEPVA